jgi:short-subunit dehydrogenase
MIDLKGKKILITGASSGIGREVAILSAKLGAQLILTGRNLSELNKTASKITSSVEIIPCDLTHEDEIEEISKNISKIDGFAHCAGIVQPFPIKFIKSKHINDMLNINLYSGILLCSNFLRQKKLNEGASIVFISSISAHHPYTGGALYSVSKSGLEAFSKALLTKMPTKK